jgi:hypothetical protein
MMRSIALFRLIVVAALAAMAGVPCAAQQQALLTWKWVEGEERLYIVESTLNQTLETEGEREPREIDVTHLLHVVERVTRVDEDGTALVTHTYQRVRVQGVDKGPEGEDRVDWDSALRAGTPAPQPSRPGVRPTAPRPTADDDKDHPLVAPYAALAGRTITYEITPDGRVLSARGADESMEGVFDAMSGDGNLNPALMLYKAAVTNESLARQLEQGLRIIPGREVRRGEAWDLSIDQTLPLVGELHTGMECRLTSLRGRPGSEQATITNKGGMTLEGGPAGVQSLGGLFQIMLGTSEMNGTTDFDAEGGYITRSSQHSVSEWELYVPDFSNLERLGEPVKMIQRIEQDVSMRLER